MRSEAAVCRSINCFSVARSTRPQPTWSIGRPLVYSSRKFSVMVDAVFSGPFNSAR